MKKILKYLGYDLISIEFDALKKLQHEKQNYNKIIDIIPYVANAQKQKDLMWNFISFAGKRLDVSTSQIMQDLLVLFLFEEKRNGFFY